MAPKKAQKMSLNAFLGDSALGSWADEMDALPTAPAARADDDRGRFGERRRDDFLSSKPDRGSYPPREDLPLPTEPPFTAFVGNLAFDLTDTDLEEFFGAPKIKTVKIIKDRDEKPKGFGYVEFTDLDALKDALSKTGSSLAGRTVRISVAEPPKERSGFGGGFDDDSKFAGNWRRDGPLPDVPSSRDGSRRRFEGGAGGPREPPAPSLSDNASDWRSHRAPARLSPASSGTDLDQGPSFKRRGSGFRSQEGGPVGAADSEETWTIGAKFKPSTPSESGSPGSRFGSIRGRSDMGPPKDVISPSDEGGWRRQPTRDSTSPNSSTPPTPQLARRKLELLPRSNAGSAVPSPLSSPNPANATAAHHPRSNPFGAAKPVDVTAKEAEVAERLEKDREVTHERVMHSMSRTSSRNASHRGEHRGEHHPPRGQTPVSPSSPKSGEASPKVLHPSTTANVRPAFSFAHAAAGKKDQADKSAEQTDDIVEETTEKLGEVNI